MTVHVAILHPVFADAIVRGLKSVEARLTTTRREPWRRIARGDRVYIKESSGPFRAAARVAFVERHQLRSAAMLDSVLAPHRDRLGPPDALDAFLSRKRDSRFALFIGFSDVRETDTGPVIPPLNGRAWVCLDEGSSVPLPMVRTPRRDDDVNQRTLWPRERVTERTT